jgi:hypothetical protein
MFRSRWLFAVICLAVCCACSPRDFLTRRLASDLIAASPVFKARQQFFLRTGILSNKDFSSPDYLVLQHRGWVIGTSASCPANVQPPPCWDVVLTPLGVGVFRDLIPPQDSSKQYFNIPTAKREVVEITGISKSDNFADAQFIWRWQPLNEVGAAMYDGGVRYSASVSFQHCEDGWRLMEGSAARTNQNLQDALKNSEPDR